MDDSYIKQSGRASASLREMASCRMIQRATPHGCYRAAAYCSVSAAISRIEALHAVVLSAPVSSQASWTAEMALRRLRLVAGGRHSRRPGCRGHAIDRRRRPTFAAGPWPPTWCGLPASSRTASGIASSYSSRTNGCCPRRRLRRRRPSLWGSNAPQNVLNEILVVFVFVFVSSAFMSRRLLLSRNLATTNTI